MAEDCCDASGFLCYINLVFSAFAHLLYTKLLCFESLGVAKSDFEIEGLTFRACQGNLSHFSKNFIVVVELYLQIETLLLIVRLTSCAKNS